MSLTREELERRRSFVTATDVAAILGANPPKWPNAVDVFLSKTRGVFKPTNDAMEAGSLLEPSIIAWASTKLGTLYPGDWRVAENGINAATLDAETADKLVVEAKSTGITGPGSPHQWGEEGTDQIPRYYLLQVHAQLLVTGAPMAYVPALIGGRGFVMYQVHRSQALCDRIAEISEQFWREHVLTRIPPVGTPHLETLKYLKRESGATVEINDDLAAAYLEASAALKEAKDAEESAKAALIASLGTAEVGKWSGGEFTYHMQTRKAHEVKESTFPVLRMEAAKNAKVSA